MKIVSEYGTPLAYNPQSYDMACRVAHYVRELTNGEYFVVGANGRATSEVFDHDARKDSYAKGVARGLV